MTENPNRQTPRKPAFGPLSLALFGFGICVSLFGPRRRGEALGIGDALTSLVSGSVLCLLGLVSAAVGLSKRETPLWPAMLGLCLCLVPAVLGLLGLIALLFHLYGL
jgi:hypothetical protein